MPGGTENGTRLGQDETENGTRRYQDGTEKSTRRTGVHGTMIESARTGLRAERRIDCPHGLDPSKFAFYQASYLNCAVIASNTFM